MADNTNQPPLATTSVKPKQVITPGDVRRRRLIGGAVLAAVIVGLGLLAWWYAATYLSAPKVETRTAQQQLRFEQASQLLVLQSNDNFSKLSNLSQAGELFMQANEPGRALKAFQEAQTLIDQKKVDDDTPRSLQLQIGDAYKALGDKDKAREAYRSFQTFLEKTTPEDRQLIDQVKKKQAEL